MSAVFHLVENGHIEHALSPVQQFARDVGEGLSRRHKRLPSKYFYDTRGSRLFQQIAELPEYYLTRAEYEIFDTHAADISRVMGEGPFNLIELGAGDGRKTERLIRQFVREGREFRYVPIDISESALRGLTEVLEEAYPELEVQAVIGDYFGGLTWHAFQSSLPSLVLFLGSSIGNMNGEETRAFLRGLRGHMQQEDRVLIDRKSVV
jgi:uncharacterized SAM-dependent methyltransferase